MVALAESTVTVTQTHTVTTDAFQQHATQTPAGHPSNAEFGPPPPPFDGTPYAGPSPAQPGFAFDPYMAPHQVPPPMFLPLAGGANYQPGAVMDPLTAVLSIIIVAGMYWGFKNGGVSEVMSKIVGKRSDQGEVTDAPDEAKKSSSSSTSKTSSSSKDKEESLPSMPSIPAVSPAAFISLVLFAVLSAVIIQGPLGLKAAFNGENPVSLSGGSPLGQAEPGSLSLTGLLEVMSAKLPGFPGLTRTDGSVHGNSNYQARSDPVPQMAGQGSSSNKDGHSQWNWYAKPLPPMNQPAESYRPPPHPRGGPVPEKEFAMSDKLAFFQLPPLLQTFPICQQEPIMCAGLAQHMDKQQLATLLGVDAPTVGKMLGQPNTVQPVAVPLVPKQGFIGSYQGLKELETLFYPMLIGAIALIILFDYGS